MPAPPRTLLARLQFLEDHIIRMEKEYPPWAALHFNQPNRGVSGCGDAVRLFTDNVLTVAAASTSNAYHCSLAPYYEGRLRGMQYSSCSRGCRQCRRSCGDSSQREEQEQIEPTPCRHGETRGTESHERPSRDAADWMSQLGLGGRKLPMMALPDTVVGQR